MITRALPEGQRWSSPVTALTPWPGAHSMLRPVFLPKHHTACEAPRAPEDYGCSSPVFEFLHGILIPFSIVLLG